MHAYRRETATFFNIKCPNELFFFMSEKSISGHLLNLASYYIYVSWCVWNPKETLNDTLNAP